MFPLVSLLFLAVTLLTPSLALSSGFEYGREKVRGVNLGSWLVLIFENTGDERIVDEWTFGQYQSHSVAEVKLKSHWNSWITENDFADIAAAGLNHVRLPIGYWAFDVTGGEPYVQGQLQYLDKAVKWAGYYGLKLIVDLHGAPGSQNGFDNSGQRMNPPTWHTKQSNLDRTNTIIRTLASKFAANTDVVSIIAPLNEPAGFYPDILEVTKQYCSYENIREHGEKTIALFHDAFCISCWNDFMTDNRIYERVAFDTHIYQVFSQEEVSRSNSDHISAACATRDMLSSFHSWIIVGEWTPAPTDCAKYLNGRGRGARYDGTHTGSTYVGDCKSKTGSGLLFSEDYKKFLRQYWEAQAISYEKGIGWIQWTWKAENADDWSYQAGLKYGWIPKVPTDYKYPKICG